MRWFGLVTLTLVLLHPVFSLPAPAIPREIPESVEITPCPFTLPSPEKEGVSYFCGIVPVPFDDDQPDGAWFDLAIAVLRATGPVVKDDPLLWLEGGPGASALVVAETNRKLVAGVRMSRDVVLIDQRGSGYSGYLDCGSYQAAAAADAARTGTPFPDPPSPQSSPEDVYAYAGRTAALGYADCRAGYAAQGIDLAWYRTETIARDAIAVLDALNAPQATVWGTSYGGRVVMELMRRYPGRIRAAVLDSPLPTGIRRLTEFGNLPMEPVAHLFGSCAADRACADAYPDLESRTLALVERLNRDPVPVARQAASRAGLPGGFDGAALVRLLTTTLPANPHIAPALPKAIINLEGGDADLALALLAGDYPPPVSRDIPPTLTETTFETLNTPADARLALSLAMRTIVLCNDEAAGITLADLVQREREIRFPALQTDTALRSSITLLAQCAALGIDIPPLVMEPPTAPIPVLVLSGAYDATTAPSWAEHAAASMIEANYLIIPEAGHAVTRWSACARTIVAAFVADPDSSVARDCLDEEQQPFLV